MRKVFLFLAAILAVFLFWLVLARQPAKKLPENEIVFFLVAYANEVGQESLPSDWEKFGCDDFLVPYKSKTQEEVNLKTALDGLFAQKDTLLPNGVTLHNSLAGSKVGIGVAEERNKTTVDLVGEIKIAGVCDTPRVRQQIEKTVEYYNPDALILYNGEDSAWRCLGDTSGLCE